GRGLVDRGGQVRVAVVVRVDQEDLAVAADGRDHVEVERDLLRPTGVAGWVGGAATLVDFAEAAVGGRARRQPVLGAVNGQVGLGVGVVVGVDDGDGLGGGRRARESVGAAEVGGTVAGRSGRHVRVALGVGDQLGVAASLLGR